MSSKLTVSAKAIPVANVIAVIVMLNFFIASFISLILVLRQRRSDLEQSTNQKPAFDGIRQIFCLAASPVMEEHDARLLVRHVLMNGDNVTLVLEQGPQDRLQ